MSAMLHLSELSPYRFQGTWQTKGRVTRLDPCRPYSNARGEGFVLSFAISDETQTMECVCFGKHAQTLAERLEKGKVYAFKSVRLTKKRAGYSTVDAPFQLTIQDAAGVVQLASEDSAEWGTPKHVDVNLIDFKELPIAIREGHRLDLLGVLVQREEKTALQSKSTAASYEKSSLLIEDENGLQVSITLWNAQIEAASTLVETEPVLLIDVHGEMKENGGNCYRTWHDEVSGFTLSAQHSTLFHAAGALDEGIQLMKNISEHESTPNKQLLTAPDQFEMGTSAPYKMVSTIPLAVMNQVETDYFRTVAIVTAIPYPPNFYLRCPMSKCGAKVEKSPLGRYTCTKCLQPTVKPGIGLTLVLDIQDYTGTAMLTTFNEAAAAFMGCSLIDAEAAYTRDSSAFLLLLANRRFLHFEFRASVTKNQAGIFAAKCWSIRTLSETQLTDLLTAMQAENNNCLVSSASSS